MTNSVRLIKHEAVPGCGSFEVRFADGRVSQYFYFEESAGAAAAVRSFDPRRGTGAGQGAGAG